MVVNLHWDVALEIGTRFTLREGNKTSECYICMLNLRFNAVGYSRNGTCYQGP